MFYLAMNHKWDHDSDVRTNIPLQICRYLHPIAVRMQAYISCPLEWFWLKKNKVKSSHFNLFVIICASHSHWYLFSKRYMHTPLLGRPQIWSLPTKLFRQMALTARIFFLHLSIRELIWMFPSAVLAGADASSLSFPGPVIQGNKVSSLDLWYCRCW